MRRWLLLLALAVATLPARAEEVVLGLSQNRVAITATFDGSEILIFGAVKRETPIVQEPPLEVVWRAGLDAAPGAAPVVSHDGVVYLPDTEGALYALDAETGERQTVLRTAWISEGSPVWPLVEQGLVARDRVPVSAAPAVAGWQLLYGDDEGVFYAVRRGESSETLWCKGISLSPQARTHRAYQAPLVVEGTVFTADAEGNLHAADARNGTARFALYLRGRPVAPPALSPRHSPPRLLASVHPVFGGEPAALHAVEPFRGERCWRRDLPDLPRRGLLAHRAGVVVGGDFGLACFALADGTPRWQVSAEDLGGPVEAPLCADRYRVFAATSQQDGAGGDVAGVDLRSGEVEWRRATGLKSPITGLACSADLVWVAAGQSLVAIVAETGKVEGRVRLPGTAVEGPTLALGRIYLALAAGEVVALAPA